MKAARMSLLSSVAIVVFVVIQSLYIQTTKTFTLRDLFFNLMALAVLVSVVSLFCGSDLGHE